MEPFNTRFSQLYDLFYAAKDYAGEAAFVVNAIRKNFPAISKPHLLELACGTGTHAFHFELNNCEVTATDASQNMIWIAEKKAERIGSGVSFRVQDMRSILAPQRPYDAVVCLFDSIGFVRTDQALAEVFDGVRRSLKPSGLFIFEFWNAAAMLSHYSPVRVKRFQLDHSTILRVSNTSLLRDQSLARVTIDLYELRDDGSYQHDTEEQVNRFFEVGEVEAFAKRSGFESIAYHSGFGDSTDISDSTWHVVAIWRRS